MNLTSRQALNSLLQVCDYKPGDVLYRCHDMDRPLKVIRLVNERYGHAHHVIAERDNPESERLLFAVVSLQPHCDRLAELFDRLMIDPRPAIEKEMLYRFSLDFPDNDQGNKLCIKICAERPQRGHQDARAGIFWYVTEKGRIDVCHERWMIPIQNGDEI